MTTAYQLPEDAGNKLVTRNGEVVQAEGSFPAGQSDESKSIPVTLPLSGFNAPLIDEYRFLTEVNRDLLGFPRVTTPYNFQAQTDTYDLSKDDWIYDVSGINERPELDSTQSARWTQLSEAKANYHPTPNGEIKHNISASSAQLILNSNDGGFQRLRIASRKRYRYQPGRVVRTSLSTKLSVTDTPISVTRLWGVGDSNDGFFVQCGGDGSGDRLQVLYRTSSGNGLPFETLIPRSEWTGDKLDGTGPSKAVLDLSKSFATLFEWGWYGATNCRIYFYLVDNNDKLPSTIKQIPRARWILAHEIMIADTPKRTDLIESDGAEGTRSYDVPSLRTPSLPVHVEINNTGNIARSEFIERYGVSVVVDGGNDDRAKISAVDGNWGLSVPPVIGGLYNGAGRSVMTLRSKERIVNDNGKFVENFLRTNPINLSCTSSELIELEIWLDPETVEPSEIGHFNGDLPYRNSDYISPFNSVSLALASFDSNGAPIVLSTASTNAGVLAAFSPYTSTELSTVDVSFNDSRIVKGGKRIASFLVDQKGASLDLNKIFGSQCETISCEYDAPTRFPTTTTTIRVKDFSTVTGLITVEQAFPLRLYLNQRLKSGSLNYYVHELTSSRTFKLKAAKVDTTPITSGLNTGDTLVAFYELDLSSTVASSLTPVYRSELVFVARPFNASYPSLDKSVEYSAEWMHTANVQTSHSYSAQTEPLVNLYLTNGVI